MPCHSSHSSDRICDNAGKSFRFDLSELFLPASNQFTSSLLEYWTKKQHSTAGGDGNAGDDIEGRLGRAVHSHAFGGRDDDPGDADVSRPVPDLQIHHPATILGDRHRRPPGRGHHRRRRAERLRQGIQIDHRRHRTGADDRAVGFRPRLARLPREHSSRGWRSRRRCRSWKTARCCSRTCAIN